MLLSCHKRVRILCESNLHISLNVSCFFFFLNVSNDNKIKLIRQLEIEQNEPFIND